MLAIALYIAVAFWCLVVFCFALKLFSGVIIGFLNALLSVFGKVLAVKNWLKCKTSSTPHNEFEDVYGKYVRE